MICSLCGSYHENDYFLHSHLLNFAVCYCCEDDMDERTKLAYKLFVKSLASQLSRNKEEEIYKNPFS